jgi:phage-related minor tail protein
MTQIDGITVAIDADTSAFQREIAIADKLARGFGASIGSALSGAIVYGRNFNDVLASLGLRLSSLTIGAALKPLEQGFSSLFQGLFSAPAGAAALAAKGAASVVPFASGGVISTPSFFPLGSNVGLAGERGAEAIMPLTRGADGRLGVAAEGRAASPNITVNVSTPDAASFRRSEAYLSGVIARAVSRGDRSL